MISCRNSILFFFLIFSTAVRADVPAVRQTTLKKIDPDSYGFYVGRDTDVLNDGMWNGAAFPKAVKALKNIKPFSPAAAAIQKNILLSTADPPAQTPENAFLTARLEKLFELGLFDEIIRLGGKIPFAVRTERQNRIFLDTLLLTDFQTACSYPADNAEKVRLICEALKGNEDETFRLTEIIREQEDDPFLFNATEAFLTKTPFTEKPQEISPLTVAVLRLAGTDFSSLLRRSNFLWLRKAYVETPGIDAEKRLPAAEKLAQVGLLDPATLRKIYDQTHVLKDDLKTAFEKAKTRGAGTAFALATRDLWEKEEPDLETLKDSAWRIEGFMLAGLPEKAAFWTNKADLIFPRSETVLNGWYWEELRPKEERFFIPRLETMIAAQRPVEQLDRIMVFFQALELVPPDEVWHLTTASLPEPLAVDGSPAEKTLTALEAMTNGRTDLVRGLIALKKLGFEREALQIAAETGVLP